MHMYICIFVYTQRMYGEVTLQFGWATHTCVYIYRSIHNMLCTHGFWGKVMDIDVAIALGHTHIYMLHILFVYTGIMCVHRDSGENYGEVTLQFHLATHIHI